MKVLLRLFSAVILTPVSLHAADGALSFDGADDYVEIPNFHNLGVTTEVTVEFWARTDVQKQQSAFLLNPDHGANRCSSHINYSNGNTYWDFGDIDNGGRVFLANPANTLGNWTHYAMVGSQSGNFMKIYANGTEIASVSSFNGFETALTYALRIGGTAGFHYDGSLDDFRVWNAARSAADIRQFMARPLTGSESGLRLYFKFDEASGSTAVNSAAATGATYDGTLTSGPIRIASDTPFTHVTTGADSGTGSLRHALANATALSGQDLITFDPALSGQTITLASEIVVSDMGGVTVDASALAAGLTLDGGPGNNRILSVNTGTTVTLKELTLTGGNGAGLGSSNAGGAINNSGTLALTRCLLLNNSINVSGSIGGAIFNNGGTVALSQCTLSGNYAAYGGAAVYNQGTLLAEDSLFSANYNSSHGGAIFNESGRTVTGRNCTFTANNGTLSGGAIANKGTITLTHCTVYGNSGIVGGGIANGSPSYTGGILNLQNSIVAGNSTGSDVLNYDNGAPDPTYNLIGANVVQTVVNTGTISQSGPAAITTNPLLAPLGNYGGPTQTMALMPGSPARNAAVGSTAIADQRGFPIVGTPDIGAYEAGTLGTNYEAYIWESLPSTATVPQHASGIDFDGDGQLNGDEWAALTDPASAASIFRILGTTLGGGNLTLSFPTVSGRSYTLQRSDDLAPGGWTSSDLPAALSGNGSVLQFNIPAAVPGVPKRFFRIQVGP